MLAVVISAAAVVAPVIVTVSLANPVMPLEAYAAFTAVAVPVRPVTVAALNAVAFIPSITLRSEAATVHVSVMHMVSAPNPVTVPAV